jgi:hypothetical protein
VNYRLCDREQAVSGIYVELGIEAEPFAETVPYRLALFAGGQRVAEVAQGRLSPAELFALAHALRDGAADGFGHFLPEDEVFGLDLAPPGVPVHADEVALAIWVDAGRACSSAPTRSGVAVQLVLDAGPLARVAESMCGEAERVLSR